MWTSGINRCQIYYFCSHMIKSQALIWMRFIKASTSLGKRFTPKNHTFWAQTVHVGVRSSRRQTSYRNSFLLAETATLNPFKKEPSVVAEWLMDDKSGLKHQPSVHLHCQAFIPQNSLLIIIDWGDTGGHRSMCFPVEGWQAGGKLMNNDSEERSHH